MKKGVFGVWGDTWSDVWCDMEKRNVQLGVTFGVTVLTRKAWDWMLYNSPKTRIGVVFGCLGGGDNPVFSGVFCVCGLSGMLGLSGGPVSATLLYLCMCVRDGRCVMCVSCATEVCGVCVVRDGGCVCVVRDGGCGVCRVRRRCACVCRVRRRVWGVVIRCAPSLGRGLCRGTARV